MNERKYIEEIEGLMVEVTYTFEDGDKGDYFTPPAGDRVTIVSWRLADGEKNVRNQLPDYDDEEWEQWMADIDHYVHNDSYYDIVEFEESLK